MEILTDQDLDICIQALSQSSTQVKDAPLILAIIERLKQTKDSLTNTPKKE